MLVVFPKSKVLGKEPQNLLLTPVAFCASRRRVGLAMCCIRLLCHIFVMDGEVPAAGITAPSLPFVHGVLLALIVADKRRHVKQAQLESPPSGTERTQRVLPWFWISPWRTSLWFFVIGYSSTSGFFLSTIIILPPRCLSGLIRSASEEHVAHYVIETDFESKFFYDIRNLSRFVPEDA